MKKIDYVKPPLKYTGSKFSELGTILPLFPDNIDKFYEPFMGGGSVFLNTTAKKYYLNDFDFKVYKFWDTIFNSSVEKVSYTFSDIDEQQGLLLWDTKLCTYANRMFSEYNRLINLNKERFYYPSDSYRNMLLFPFIDKSKKFIEKNNIADQVTLRNIAERDHQGSVFYRERSLYNNLSLSQLSTIFWINEFSYGGMSRYNSKGEFNIPYGGLSYNKKDILPKIKSLLTIKYSYDVDEVYNEDFEYFLVELKFNYTSNDFIFLDPPYTTTFSSYGNNVFDKNDHIRLKNVLENIQCKFLMVINYDDFTKELYENNKFIINTYDKKYKVNIKGRMNNDGVKHMIVKNY